MSSCGSLGDPSDPWGSSYVQAKPRHTVIDVCPLCSARLLPWVLHVMLGCSRTWSPRRTVMGSPWDVCHQALVPLEPSPIPSVTARGLLAAAHHILQGWGRAELVPGLQSLLETQGVLPTAPLVTAVAKGDPQPSTPLPWEC